MKIYTPIILALLPFSTFAQLPTGGLIAWYPFCGNASDQSGNGRNLTVTGPTLTTDRFGSANCAYYFSGSTSGINNILHCTPPMPTDTSDFTYSCWLEPDVNGNMQVIANGDCDIAGYELTIIGATCCASVGNNLAIVFGGINMYLPTSVTLNQWHHAVMRRTVNNFDLFIDSVLVGSFTGTFSPTNPAQDFAVGENYLLGSNSFQGKIDDIAIYNRALSNSEILQLYHYNPVCTTVPPLLCDSLSLPDTLYECFEIPITIPAILYGPDSVTSIAWTPTPGISDPEILDPTISAPASGWYYLTVQSIIPGGSCTALDSVYVDLVTPGITYSHRDISFCSDLGSIKLNVPIGYSSYLWNTGVATTSIIADSGIYWVNASVSCASLIDTFYVTPVATPRVNLGSDTSFCDGNSITLNSVQPPGAQYIWSNGSTSSSITVSSAGTYSLTVTQRGCSAFASVSIGELYKPGPINLGPDTILCNDGQLKLSVNDSTGSFLWNTGNIKQEITVTEPGNYWVTVSDICGSVSDTINVNFELCDIWLPSAFTPNGDGLNDVIHAVGNLLRCKDFSLSIYNRWGQRVFHTEDIYEGWNGRFIGVNQEVGTYYYMMYFSLEGRSHVMKGDLELIR